MGCAGVGAPAVHSLQVSAVSTQSPCSRHVPHVNTRSSLTHHPPSDVSHTNLSKASKDYCPAQLTPGSSDPSPRGSLGLEFREELLQQGWSRKGKSS